MAAPATFTDDTRLNPCAVAVRGLTKRYRDGCEALRGVDLEVAQGQIFGLIGPDGAGKTTALNIMAGVLPASGGEVLVFGSSPRQARQDVRYVTQTLSLYPDLTVDENLRYDAGLCGVPEQEFKRLSAEYLKQMGLSSFRQRSAGTLSGGMAHKLALCCALISRPRLLLLDEPTTGLDPMSRREVWQVLHRIAKERVTVIIATPYLEEAEGCARVALLYEGTVHETGAPQELEAALGVRRLQVSAGNLEGAEKALARVTANKVRSVIDAYTVGERLDVLVKDTWNAEQEVRTLLAEAHVPVKTVCVTDPNLENVFVLRLREHGLGQMRTTTRAGNGNGHGDPNGRHGDDAAIVVENLTKRFKDFQAVNNASLAVRYGEIYGLLGANGAGKTTTIKMLCGLIQPTSGQFVLAGESGKLRSRKVRQRIGYMSQRFTLYPGLTVRENLEFYVSVYGLPLSGRQESVEWALEVGDLGKLEDTLVGRLPRGSKQRVAFGASIMHRPDILFLDEPTAGLDPIARRQMWRSIRELAGNGTAVLVTTHYLEEAEYCNRLGFMAQGKIVVQGSPHDIRTRHQGTVIEVTADDAQAAFEALRANKDPWRVSMSADRIRILLDDDDIASIKRTLKESQLEMLSLRTVPFSLEDAFIAIVKRNEGDRDE